MPAWSLAERGPSLQAEMPKGWKPIVWLAISLAVGLAGCASFDGPLDGGAGGTGGSGGVESKTITVACASDITALDSLLPWELRVTTLPIVSGNDFAPTLVAVAVFDESFLDGVQRVVGVREFNLVELNATVHVRSGATGADVVLKPDPEPIPYECFLPPRAPCDPMHDLEGVPGARGNTDCVPERDVNPCGRFIDFPISDDCESGGECFELGKATGPVSQCALNGFCVTGDLRLELESKVAIYTAGAAGEVLFGWADESTGAMVRESGSNAGSWRLPRPDYTEPTGALGLRLAVGLELAAVECTMGVDCKGPDGPDPRCADTGLSSPTPNAALISFPIQP